MDQVEEQLTPMQRFFSFAEIVKGRDASVPVTDDGLLHAIPYVSVMTGKNRDDAGRAIRNLSNNVFHSEKFTYRQLSRHGGYPTKLISFEDAIELAMVLPGKIAKETRKQFVGVIVRYLDGDESMCQELGKNRSMGKVQSYTAFFRTVIGNVQEKLDRSNANNLPSTGYIYATKSPAFPGLVKIGRTESVYHRLIQLNTSCAPAPHVVIAMAPTLNMNRDEKTAHAFFSDAREEGEFFRILDEDVISYFVTHITAQYHLETSSRN
jgi:hypothetical protein